MIPHQQMVVSGGFPTERRGFFFFFAGKSEGQKRVSGGILRAEGGFPGIPHQQKVVYLGIPHQQRMVSGDCPRIEGSFQEDSPQAEGFQGISQQWKVVSRVFSEDRRGFPPGNPEGRR